MTASIALIMEAIVVFLAVAAVPDFMVGKEAITSARLEWKPHHAEYLGLLRQLWCYSTTSLYVLSSGSPDRGHHCLMKPMRVLGANASFSMWVSLSTTRPKAVNACISNVPNGTF